MADMKQAYMEVIRSDLWSGEEIEYSEFFWAWFCVNSRSVFYRSAGSEFVREDGNHLALAPYLELLNHSVGAKVEAGYNQESGCYEIHTGDTYRKHSQVFISYGNHDNYHLLVEYGFTLPDNPNDVFQVEYDDVLNAALSLSVDYMEKKKEIIQQQSFHRHWTTEESLNAGIGKTEELLNAGIGRLKSLNAGIGKTEKTLNAGIGRLRSGSMQAVDD